MLTRGALWGLLNCGPIIRQNSLSSFADPVPQDIVSDTHPSDELEGCDDSSLVSQQRSPRDIPYIGIVLMSREVISQMIW